MFDPSLQRLIQSGMAQPYEAGHSVPRGWALCCPFCEGFKMRHTPYTSLGGFQCTGVDLGVCGKFISEVEVTSHKALYVVKE